MRSEPSFSLRAAGRRASMRRDRDRRSASLLTRLNRERFFAGAAAFDWGVVVGQKLHGKMALPGAFGA